MASVSIYREERNGTVRWRVLYRLGGRTSKRRHGGSFQTKRLAEKRADWIRGELAHLRVPDLTLLEEPRTATVFRDVADAWRSSRVDVAGSTAATHRVNLNRLLPALGERPIEEIEPDEIAALVAELHEGGLKRESIRKTISTLAQVFDHGGRSPNPARDRRLRLPREDRPEVNPPTATHVEAAYWLLPTAHRLPLLVDDATGMRVSELESLAWGDVDEPELRLRVSQAWTKTRTARWVPVPEELFRRVCETVPREDRDLGAQLFAGFSADRFRTAVTRACKAAGIPVFSPHDLRHRRASLWHLGGVPAAEASSWLGHSAQEHLRTYAHVVIDRTEIDYAALLDASDEPERARKVARGWHA